jgi:hypothetical protein
VEFAIVGRDLFVGFGPAVTVWHVEVRMLGEGVLDPVVRWCKSEILEKQKLSRDQHDGVSQA